MLLACPGRFKWFNHQACLNSMFKELNCTTSSGGLQNCQHTEYQFIDTPPRSRRSHARLRQGKPGLVRQTGPRQSAQCYEASLSDSFGVWWQDVLKRPNTRINWHAYTQIDIVYILPNANYIFLFITYSVPFISASLSRRLFLYVRCLPCNGLLSDTAHENLHSGCATDLVCVHVVWLCLHSFPTTCHGPGRTPIAEFETGFGLCFFP